LIRPHRVIGSPNPRGLAEELRTQTDRGGDEAADRGADDGYKPRLRSPDV
jgi:hypothetical protein